MTQSALWRRGPQTGKATQVAGRGTGGMLRWVAALSVGLAVALSGGAQAQDTRPVVLELYTSQGCASCPPADDMLAELAVREDVIALALHVDYWDYIGWPDTFAHRRHTERQQAYARRHGHSTIYTPQVVVNGIELIEGFRTLQVMESIAMQAARPVEVALSLTWGEGGVLEVLATPAGEISPGLALTSRRGAAPGIAGTAVIGGLSLSRAAGAVVEAAPVAPAPVAPAPSPGLVAVDPVGPFVVQLVRYVESQSVDILGGENAGRRATYANIVTSWMTVANWDMMAPLALRLPVSGRDPVVVLIQEAGMGEVIAAARLR